MRLLVAQSCPAARAYSAVLPLESQATVNLNRLTVGSSCTQRPTVRKSLTVATTAYNANLLNRSAFEITETELNVMAALAMRGLSSRPKNG